MIGTDKPVTLTASPGVYEAFKKCFERDGKPCEHLSLYFQDNANETPKLVCLKKSSYRGAVITINNVDNCKTEPSGVDEE